VDFCPDLDGLQWENYDCNTPQSPAPEATVPAEPAALVTAATAVVPQLVSTPVNAAMPAQVAVPTEQTPPAAVDAGYGPTSAPVSPLWAVLMILAGCLGATGAARAAGKGSV
jgi:hypothetical protein